MAISLERAVRRAARSAVTRAAVRLGAGAVAALALAFSAGSVAAHGETYLQLGSERIQPGGQIEVRADLGAGDAFEATLISKADGSRRILGTLPATEEGHLQTYLTIPADVPAGDYLVELAYDLTVLRAPLTVAGAPITGGEDGQQPGQDDGFGAAPSMTGGALPAAPSAGPIASGEAPASVRGRRDGIEGLAIVAIAGGAAAGLLAVIRFVRRPSRPKP